MNADLDPRRFMAPEGRTDNTEKWYVDVISSQWKGATPPSCSDTWSSLPEIGGLPDWLTSPEKGQKIIRDFGKEKYGSPLFFPNSKEWRSLQGKTN